MNVDELQQVYERLSELVTNGTEEQMNQYLLEQFPRLPENLQAEIILRKTARALKDAIDGEDALEEVREEVDAGLELLEKLEKEISKAQS